MYVRHLPALLIFHSGGLYVLALLYAPLWQVGNLPFACNGRTSESHCPAALVLPTLGRAVDLLHTPLDSLDANSWSLYGILQRVSPAMGTYRMVENGHVQSSRGSCYCLFVQILGVYYTTEAELQSSVTTAVNQVLSRCSLGRIVAVEKTDGVLQVRTCRPTPAALSAACSVVCCLFRCLLLFGKGPDASWLCVLEFKRKQEGAELQIARYYYDFIRALARESSPLLVKYPHLPCISVEIAGNDMR